MDVFYQYIEILGVISFALSGALTAIQKKFDGFGIVIIGFVTAIGGGTLRDLILNEKVFWVEDSKNILLILIAVFIAIVFRNKIHFIYRPLMFFDALGLGLFTVTGTQIGIYHGLDMIHSVIVGTMTGTFGGIIRDILVNEIPVIFQKEIYATISLAGGAMYFGLLAAEIPPFYSKLIPVVFIVLLRLFAIRFHWSLPSIYKSNE